MRPISGTQPRVPRVLIIDDEPLLAEVLRRALSDEFDVTATTRASEALQGLIAGDDYDLILCDVMMPVLEKPIPLVVLRDMVRARVRGDTTARAALPW